MLSVSVVPRLRTEKMRKKLGGKREGGISSHSISIWDRDFVFVEDSVYFLSGPKPGSEKMKRLSIVKLSSLPLHLQ